MGESPLRSSTEIITDDLPCGSCGYNLRSLDASARCPECGQNVGETLDTCAGLDTAGLRAVQPLRDSSSLLAGVPVITMAATVVAFALVWLFRFYAVLGTLFITLQVLGVLYYLGALSFVRNAGRLTATTTRVAPCVVITAVWLGGMIAALIDRLGTVALLLIGLGWVALIGWTSAHAVRVAIRMNRDSLRAHARLCRRVAIPALILLLALTTALLALHLTERPKGYVAVRLYLVGPAVLVAWGGVITLGIALMFRLHRPLTVATTVARYRLGHLKIQDRALDPHRTRPPAL